MSKLLRRSLAVAAMVAATATVPAAPSSAGSATCFGQQPTIVGTKGDDHLRGTPGADVIAGLGGSDMIHGEEGNDLICADSDTPSSDHQQDDRLFGGSGNDQLQAAFVSTLEGGSGDDVFVAASNTYGESVISYVHSPVGVEVDLDAGAGEGLGHDTFSGVFRTLYGSEHGDVLRGHDLPRDQCVQGGCENLFGLGGDDVMYSRDGSDSLVGGHGDDQLFGGAGRDGFLPGPGNDRMSDSGDTHDTLSFWHAAHGIHVDVRAGTATGQGHDRFTDIEDVAGSNHADVIKGSHGINHMEGFGGPDRLYGRARHDALSGDAGDDVLIGGPGPRDYAFGSVGTDVCEAEVTELCERSSR